MVKISDEQYFLCIWYYIFPKLSRLSCSAPLNQNHTLSYFPTSNTLTAYVAELAVFVNISTFISWLHATIIDMYYKKFTLEEHTE